MGTHVLALLSPALTYAPYRRPSAVPTVVKMHFKSDMLSRDILTGAGKMMEHRVSGMQCPVMIRRLTYSTAQDIKALYRNSSEISPTVPLDPEIGEMGTTLQHLESRPDQEHGSKSHHLSTRPASKFIQYIEWHNVSIQSSASTHGQPHLLSNCPRESSRAHECCNPFI